MKHVRICAWLLIVATLITSVAFAASGKTGYVVYNTACVYQKASDSSKCLGTLGYGAKVTVTEVSGKYSKVSGGGLTGYCKTSTLSTKDPCTLNTKVYAKKDIKVYALPNTSSSTKSATVKSGTALTANAKFDKWYRVTNGSNIAYVLQSDVSTTKVTAAAAPKSSGSSQTTSTSSKTGYVGIATLSICQKADSSSKVLTTVGYGTKLTVSGTSGKYSKVTVNGTTGYAKTSCITAKDPNTLNQTVYAKKDIKVYALPNTGAKSTSVKINTSMTVTAKVDSWYRVKNGNTVAYVKQSDVSTSKVAVSSATKVNKTSYVKSATADVYEKASTSSEKKGVLVFGDKCTVSEIDGSFSKVKCGSVTGYVKTSSLTDTNPNTVNKKVYPQSNSIKVYAYPSTSAQSVSVSYSTALTCTAKYDSTWLRVTYGSKVAFVKASDVDTKKYDGYSTSKPAAGKSKSMDWFKSGIQSIFYKGRIATVTDIKTGISWQVKRTGGSNHADVQPLTAADTAAMKKACGSDFGTWHRRAIWVSIGSEKYAASMNCMPHGNGSITTNNFNGHHCIHFTNSKTHGTGKVDPDHQATIKKALAAG